MSTGISRFASREDIGRSVRLTYNGRECGVFRLQLPDVGEGAHEIPQIVVTAMLPKDWDQGPAPVPPILDGHRVYVRHAFIDEHGELQRIQVVDRESGRTWELSR